MEEGTYLIIGIIILLAIAFFSSEDITFVEKVLPESPNITFSDEPININVTVAISIANWNLQIFGPTKASDPILMNKYVNILNDYDIIFVQEIRDATGEAWNDLCDLMPAYSCDISSRAGRSTSKEQYGIMYKKSINLTTITDYNPDPYDRWERPPIMARFNYEGYEFDVYNIHVKPDDAASEIFDLYYFISGAGNTIVMGDLNADCDYYNNDIWVEFDDWHWLIKDYDDTTVSDSTNCAYDRIIISDGIQKELYSFGIQSEGITSEMSDHYIVWLEVDPHEK